MRFIPQTHSNNAQTVLKKYLKLGAGPIRTTKRQTKSRPPYFRLATNYIDDYAVGHQAEKTGAL